MNKFVREGILFFLILSAYFLFNFLLNKFIITLSPPQLNISTLIIGDSHIMQSIDDSQFRSAKNIAQEAEPYPVTYFKLRELIKHNSFDTILLGFSCQNISAFNDQKFSNTFWSDPIFKRIYSITKWKDFRPFIINKKSYLKAIFRNMLLYPKLNHQSFLGSYRKSKGRIDTTRNHPSFAIKRHFYSGEKPNGISKHSLAYLDSMIFITQSNHIKLILVDPPVHPDYKARIPSQIINEFIRAENKITANGIVIVHLSNKDYKNEDYLDYDHLNHQGATRFTRELIKAIKPPG